jgi:hypothetical protein
MTQQHDLANDIVTDHREVEGVFAEIDKPENPSQRRELVEHVIAELVRHRRRTDQQRDSSNVAARPASSSCTSTSRSE